MDANQKALEKAEIQAHIDKYQTLTPTQLRDMLYDEGLFTPPQEQDVPLQNALGSLLRRVDPAPQVSTPAPPAFLSARGRRGRTRPKRWRRLIVAAAVIVSLLMLSALAYTVHQYVLQLNIQETFTQPKVVTGPEAVAATWSGVSVPTYAPPGFTMSDAIESDGMNFLAYTRPAKQGQAYYENN